MKLSNYIKYLKKLEELHGDVDVVIYDDFGLGQPFKGAKHPFFDKLVHVEGGHYTYGQGYGEEVVIRLK